MSPIRCLLWISLPVLVLLPGARVWLPEPSHLGPRMAQFAMILALLLAGRARCDPRGGGVRETLLAAAVGTLVLPALLAACMLDGRAAGFAPMASLLACWWGLCLALRRLPARLLGGWSLLAAALLVLPVVVDSLAPDASPWVGIAPIDLSPWLAAWRAAGGEVPLATCLVVLSLAFLAWSDGCVRRWREAS